MKRYTVKQVIKLEERAENLKDISRQRLDELYFLPLSLLSGMGIVLTMGYFKEGCESILPLILGATATLSGVTSQIYLSYARQIRGKLYDKINKIYGIMGDDFKSEVKAERFRQKNEHKDAYKSDPAFDLYSDEEIDKFFGEKKR